MPYQSVYVPAKKFMQFRGISIYHVYKDNDIENGERRYCFSLEEDSDDHCVMDGLRNFDVKDLSIWEEARGLPPTG